MPCFGCNKPIKSKANKKYNKVAGKTLTLLCYECAMAGQYSEDVGKKNEYNAAQVAISDEIIRVDNLLRDRRVILDNKYPGVVDAYFNSFKIELDFNGHVSASVLEYPVIVRSDDKCISIRTKNGGWRGFGCRCDELKPTFLNSIIGDFFSGRLSSKCDKIKYDFGIEGVEKVYNTREEFFEYYKCRMIELKINNRTDSLIRCGAIRKNTSKQSILNALSLAPLAKYINPSDPIVSMAYLRRCNIKAGKKIDKEKLKTDFQDKVDTFRSIIDVEGLRISEYLGEKQIGLPMLDEHFEKIKSGLLIPELNSLIGKARTDKMVEKVCFFNFFRRHWDKTDNVNYSTFAKEMIFFEESDLVSRKTEVKKYTINKIRVESELEKYISGERFSSLSKLARESRGFCWWDW